MAEEPRCVIDPTVPCRACSAPGPDQCPYRYLLGWTDEPETVDPPPGPEPLDAVRAGPAPG
jgi:hypothetical protein